MKELQQAVERLRNPNPNGNARKTVRRRRPRKPSLASPCWFASIPWNQTHCLVVARSNRNRKVNDALG